MIIFILVLIFIAILYSARNDKEGNFFEYLIDIILSPFTYIIGLSEKKKENSSIKESGSKLKEEREIHLKLMNSLSKDELELINKDIILSSNNFPQVISEINNFKQLKEKKIDGRYLFKGLITFSYLNSEKVQKLGEELSKK